MTATAPTADLIQQLHEVARLEVQITLPVPCERPGHPDSAGPCVASEPARWRARVSHLGPNCDTRVMLLCDPSVRWMLDFAASELAPAAAVLCTRCGRCCNSADDLIVVLGEV